MRISLQSSVAWPVRDVAHKGSGPLGRLVAAESQGYDGVWLVERSRLSSGASVSPTLCAAALAARTQRIRIGALAFWPAELHPLRLAEDVAMVDVVSHGRIDWGVSLAPSGADAAMHERIEAVRRAWAPRSSSEAAEPDDPECVPPPAQQGGPPLFLAADDEVSAGWAWERGHGWITPARFTSDGPVLAAPASEPRPSSAILAVAVSVCLTERGAEAPPPESLAGEAIACRDGLARLVEQTRPDELIVCFDRAGSDESRVARSQQWFIEEVASDLR